MGTQETPIWIGGIWKSVSFNSSTNLTRLDYAVPEQVKKFLQYFQDMIKVIVKVQSTRSKCNRVRWNWNLQFMLIVFRKATCMRWTTCTRPPSPSWPTSTSRWGPQSRKVDGIQDVWNCESNYLLTWQNHLQASPWPEAEDVAPYVNDDPIFLNLYRC